MSDLLSVQLADATPIDAPGIAAIWNPIIRDTVMTFWPTERPVVEIARLIEDRQATGHAFLVARGARGVAGFASYGQFRNGGGYARTLEHTIHVDPAFRGKGVGRALMDRLLRHAAVQGGRVMNGAVTASNTASLSFHRAGGFAEWGRIPCAGFKFDRFHDLVLMGRDLSLQVRDGT